MLSSSKIIRKAIILLNTYRKGQGIQSVSVSPKRSAPMSYSSLLPVKEGEANWLV